MIAPCRHRVIVPLIAHNTSYGVYERTGNTHHEAWGPQRRHLPVVWLGRYDRYSARWQARPPLFPGSWKGDPMLATSSVRLHRSITPASLGDPGSAALVLPGCTAWRAARCVLSRPSEGRLMTDHQATG